MASLTNCQVKLAYSAVATIFAKIDALAVVSAELHRALHAPIFAVCTSPYLHVAHVWNPLSRVTPATFLWVWQQAGRR